MTFLRFWEISCNVKLHLFAFKRFFIKEAFFVCAIRIYLVVFARAGLNKYLVSRVEFFLILETHQAVASKVEEHMATEYGCPASALMTKRKHSLRKQAQTWRYGMDSEGWHVKKKEGG